MKGGGPPREMVVDYLPQLSGGGKDHKRVGDTGGGTGGGIGVSTSNSFWNVVSISTNSLTLCGGMLLVSTGVVLICLLFVSIAADSICLLSPDRMNLLTILDRMNLLIIIVFAGRNGSTILEETSCGRKEDLCSSLFILC